MAFSYYYIFFGFASAAETNSLTDTHERHVKEANIFFLLLIRFFVLICLISFISPCVYVCTCVCVCICEHLYIYCTKYILKFSIFITSHPITLHLPRSLSLHQFILLFSPTFSMSFFLPFFNSISTIRFTYIHIQRDGLLLLISFFFALPISSHSLANIWIPNKWMNTPLYHVLAEPKIENKIKKYKNRDDRKKKKKKWQQNNDISSLFSKNSWHKHTQIHAHSIFLFPKNLST